ncbi:MAG: hypothetical protein ACPGRZ_11560 [Alphaproteobacteria bacterium]
MSDFYELARQFVCMVVAATLSLTVSVVDKMLSQRPEWAEKVALLEAQFRAISEGQTEAAPAGRTAAEGSGSAGAPAGSGGNMQGLVEGYTKLLEFTEYVKVRGLMLDAEFCERVEREWSVKKLLSCMLTAEKSLKEQAAETHQAAAMLLGHRSEGK